MKYLLLVFQFTIYLNINANEIDSLIYSLKQADDKSKLRIYEELCIAYYSIDLDSAGIFAENKLKIAKRIKDVEQIAISLKLFGNINYFKGDYSLAIKYYKEALDYAQNANLTDVMASLINNLGNVCIEQGNYDQALSHFYRVLKIDSVNNNLSGVGSSLTNIGNIYLHKSQYSDAIDYYKRALSIAKDLDDVPRIISAYNNLGLAYHWISDFEKTSEYYLLALKITEEVDDYNNMLSILLNLGSLYYEWGYFPKSLDFFEKVKKISTKINNIPNLVRALESIGVIYNDLNKPDSAICMFQFGLEHTEKMNNPEITSSIYLNLGYSYELKKDYIKAKDYYNKSLVIREKLPNKDDIAASLTDLGRISYLMKDFKAAILYIEQSNQTAIYLYTKIENYKLLSDIYQSLNMTNKAFQSFKEYSLLRDSVFSIDKHKQIQELQTKYETEKKERQIDSLTKEKEIEVLKNQQSRNYIILLLVLLLIIIFSAIIFFRNIKLLNKQRTIVLEQQLLRSQMNPHFIFNAISSIQSYVIKNKADEASLFLSNFAKLMRHILLNSREEFISLEDEIDTLENYLKLQQLRFDGKFDYKINISEEIDPEEVVIPPMILQPFIENAIKHGLSKKNDNDGMILLDFSIINNKLYLEVEDNGIGRTEADKLKNNEHKSLATEITQSRLKLLGKLYKKNAQIKIIDLADNENYPIGTKVVMELPLKVA